MTGIAEFYEGILNNPNISIAPQSTEWVAELERTYDIVRAKLPTRSKHKGSKILVPIVMFMFFKMSAVFVKTQDYLEHVGMDRSKFLSYLNKIQPLHEEYSLRDRRAYAESVIASAVSFFDLGTEFQSRCQEILDVFFSQLKNTTEEMIATMVCVLSKITLDKKKPGLGNICAHVGVGRGSINTFFKKKLAEQVLGTDEFEGFVKSAELIRVNCLKILDKKKKTPKKLLETQVEKKPIKKKPRDKKPVEKRPIEKKSMEKKEKAIAPPQKEINFKDMFSRISKKLYMELESELLGYLEGVPGISIELISLMTSEITEKSLELFSEALKSVKLMKKE